MLAVAEFLDPAAEQDIMHSPQLLDSLQTFHFVKVSISQIHAVRRATHCEIDCQISDTLGTGHTSSRCQF